MLMKYRCMRICLVLNALATIHIGCISASAEAVRNIELDVTTRELGSAPSVDSERRQPNIVLILLDDAGFAASETFGGPAETPTLGRLASEGLRYNRFHTSALCSPTRASLLSGRNDHRVGFGTTTEASWDAPGYNGIWKESTASIAEVLRRNGYSTAAFGKWHNTPPLEISPVGPFDRWPTGLGFDYFYGHMGGAGSQWEPVIYRNTTLVEPTVSRNQAYHFTTDIADEAMTWLQTHHSIAPEKPYFLYFAPAATHAPHHVSRRWIDKYRGRFDRGWDELRSTIFRNQKRLGIVPSQTKLTPRPKEIPAWDSLSVKEQKGLSKQMEVYAAFLSHTDYEIGRLLEIVQRGPRGRNTLILYIASDNGASAQGGGADFQMLFQSASKALGAQSISMSTRLVGLGQQVRHFSG